MCAAIIFKQKLKLDEVTHTHTHTHLGYGSDFRLNTTSYSPLENSRSVLYAINMREELTIKKKKKKKHTVDY